MLAKYKTALFVKGTKKTLVLREVAEDGVERLLCNKEALAACDIALFIYDRYYFIHSLCLDLFLLKHLTSENKLF